MDQSKTGKQPETQLASVVAAQGAKLDHLTSGVDSAFSVVQKEISDLRQSSAGTVAAIAKLSDQLTALTTAITSSTVPSAIPPPTPPVVGNAPPGLDPAFIPFPEDTLREPRIPSPKVYEGDLSLCCGFITQCELIFQHNPSRYHSDNAKIAFIVSLLSGRALEWAVASLNYDALISSSYSHFVSEFRLVFDHPPDGSDSAARLHSICQGARSVAEFAVEFRILAAKSFWGDEALRSAFRRGLNDQIKDLILRDQPASLAELIALALKVDNRLRERRIEKNTRNSPVTHKPSRSSLPRNTTTATFPITIPSSPVSGPSDIEPMQVGRSRLTQAMREHRMQNKLCLYCGKTGHFIQNCDVKPKDQTH